jgi:elongation factor G
MGPFEPLISLEIEPKTKADQENLLHGLQELMAEDPMVRVHTDRLTGRAALLGMGELQLEIIVDRLRREFNVEAKVGKPQVAYKEALTRQADGDGRYIKQAGGRGQYGHVKIHLHPGKPGTGYIFESEVVDGSIPDAFIRPIEEGIKEALTHGVLSGHPIDDVRIELYDGSYHDVDSSEATFRIAGAMAFQDAAKRASPGRATYSMLFEGYEPLPGGPEGADEDHSAPVTAPYRPMPRGKDSAVALPEPDDEGPESAR